MISGAACRLPDLDSVLIARHEVVGRRHFDLAHELFHILTWDAMPPEHWEEALDNGGSRVEQLANNFAAAVLMPAGSVVGLGDWSRYDDDALIARLNASANELDVTASIRSSYEAPWSGFAAPCLWTPMAAHFTSRT